MLQLESSLKSHRFSPELRRRLQPLFRSDDWHGPLDLLQIWLQVAGAIAGSWLAFLHLSLPLALPIYFLSLLLIGSRQRALANVLHSSSHWSLALNRNLNLVLGTVFSAWPMLMSWSGYHYQHIKHHHPHLGDPQRDPDFVQMLQTGLYKEGVSRADVLRYLRSIPSPRHTLNFFRYMLQDRIWPEHQDPKENLLRFLFATTVLSVVVWQQVLFVFVLYWAVPLVTTGVWVTSFIEFLEHYPLMARRGAPEVLLSRNRLLGVVGDFLLNGHFDSFHLVHHLFPRVPAWNSAQAHQILMEDDVYHQANSIPKGLTPLIRDILSMIDHSSSF